MSVEEFWKPVVGYEDRYQVSNLGRVFSIESDHPATGRILNAAPNRRGYPRVCLTGNDGKRRARFVHTLVCEAFHGLCPPGEETLHRNGVHNDARSENLRWGTHQENADDAKSHGVILRGEALPQAKITDSQVAEIIRLAGILTHEEIGERYAITPEYARQLANCYSPRARRVIDGLRRSGRNPKDLPAACGHSAGR